MRTSARAVLAIVVGLGLLFLAGPRVPVDEPVAAPALPENLVDYLARAEARFDDIVPGTEKTIVWARPEQRRTPLSIVYLHGFSATRQETAPLSERVAAALGANLYYTRLTGHGRPAAALAQATVADWLSDAAEALEIGKRIGERVVVIGCSTGATLATWLALNRHEHLHALVLMSPNFALRDTSSEMLTWPWARYLIPVVMGADYAWQPHNEQQARYWTYRYPSTALLPMIALVKHVRDSDFTALTTPVLVIYSRDDEVVQPAAIERVYSEFGSARKQLIAIPQSAHAVKHVLAGDILDPDNTGPVSELIVKFVVAAEQPLQTDKPSAARP
jgi:esterase/lipase